MRRSLGRVGRCAAATGERAGGYGQTTATFTAYQRVSGGWQVAFGAWEAEVGYNGFASPGAKRGGDGRTPSGTYGFDFFFGVDPTPACTSPTEW